MNTTFQQLNDCWRAEPDGPSPRVEWRGNDLRLTFFMNPQQLPAEGDEELGEIIFEDCARYRIGILNDEGWHRGQGRWTEIPHEWGEFYEVHGDLRLEAVPNDWHVRDSEISDRSHFLFYFRDQDFECDARDWTLNVIKTSESAEVAE